MISLGRGFTLDMRYVEGDLLTLAGAFCFSLFTVFGKEAVGRIGAVRMTALCYLFATPMFFPVCLLPAWHTDYGAVSWSAWASLGYTILGATILSYTLWYWSLKKLLASRVAAFTYLQPLIAMVASFLIFGEILPPRFFAGAAAVFAGLFLAQRG
jgi:drug/metabolite transporter (DMT)-like permease